MSPRTVLAARNAAAVAFVLNGFLFATWVSRIPEARSRLGLDNGQLGLLLLCISIGSILAMPSAGWLIERWGAANVVRAAAVAVTVGLVLVGVGLGSGPALAAPALFVYGLGVGVWDVAMNVEAASVERHLGRTVMPRFHAGWSLGSVAGGGLGAASIGLGVPMAAHLPVLAVAALVVVLATVGRFLPAEAGADEHEVPTSAGRAWLEPRTLLIGVMVLALALTEGVANDWLALALHDGYDIVRSVAVLGFALFTAAMVLGRLVGPVVLDRFGRVAVLWSTMAAAGVGVLMIVFGASSWLVALGIVLWGLGASLGFPVGMSAAADEPRGAAARVSVVSTIGYGAFLAGPPLVGFVGDHVGTLRSLLVVAVLLIPAALVVPAARKGR